MRLHSFHNLFLKYIHVISSGSPLRDKLNIGILALEEKGTLEKLRNKWWKSGGLNCQDEVNAYKLGFENIGGAFILLLLGISLVLIIAVIESICAGNRGKLLRPKASRDSLRLIVDEVLSAKI